MRGCMYSRVGSGAQFVPHKEDIVSIALEENRPDRRVFRPREMPGFLPMTVFQIRDQVYRFAIPRLHMLAGDRAYDVLTREVQWHTPVVYERARIKLLNTAIGCQERIQRATDMLDSATRDVALHTYQHWTESLADDVRRVRTASEDLELAELGSGRQMALCLCQEVLPLLNLGTCLCRADEASWENLPEPRPSSLLLS